MIHRFFIEPRYFTNTNFIIDDKKIIHQMIRVLRISPGEVIILLDNAGFEFEAKIQEISMQKVSGMILHKRMNTSESEQAVILYQALPKKLSLFELVLQKGTEIGVKMFVPLLTRRTERQTIPNIERLHLIIRESAEQSGRGILPALFPPEKFSDVMRRIPSEKSIVFDPSGTPWSHIRRDIIDIREIHIFIGPEGGFDTVELDEIRKKQVRIASLGPRILRTETAGIIAPSLFLFK